MGLWWEIHRDRVRTTMQWLAGAILAFSLAFWIYGYRGTVELATRAEESQQEPPVVHEIQRRSSPDTSAGEQKPTAEDQALAVTVGPHGITDGAMRDVSAQPEMQQLPSGKEAGGPAEEPPPAEKQASTQEQPPGRALQSLTHPDAPTEQQSTPPTADVETRRVPRHGTTTALSEDQYLTSLRELVALYDASRKQFNSELQMGTAKEASASQAYQTRLALLGRLRQLEPPPHRYATVHKDFDRAVRQALETTRRYYETQDREALRRDSDRITARLQRVKRKLGVRDQQVLSVSETRYLSALRQLVVLYDTSRKQFNNELQSDTFHEASAALAYEARSGILNRLDQLEPPQSCSLLHNTFRSVVQDALDAVTKYRETEDREVLGRDSDRLKAELQSVKQALGLPDRE